MLARIENSEVVEYRDIGMQDVPEHKRGMWLPVVHEGEGAVVTVTVEAERVLMTHSAAPPVVPRVISDRQFFQQLANLGVITSDEALAAVGPGTIPAAMEAMIAGLPEADQFASRMLLTGATQFERQHHLVGVFAAAFGWSSADIDEFWISASLL